MNKPNIILLSIDTLRADEVGCINPASNLTPNMDKLAKEGKFYTNCFSQGPNTRSSFCSIMSSTYPLMFGDYRKTGIKRRISFVELLKKSGYITAGFHSNPYLSGRYGYDKGFDFFYDAMERRSKLSLLGIEFSRRFGDKAYKLLLLYNQKLKRFMGKFVPLRKKRPYVNGNVIVNLGKEFLEKNPNPFFLWLHFMDVHGPHIKADKDLPLKTMKCAMGQYKFSQEEINVVKSLRAETIKYVDGLIGDFLNFLKQKNLYQNTIIFIISDHGEEFLEHGRHAHGDRLYDELLHVPLISNVGNGASDELRENSDISVSILEIAGISVPAVFMGESLSLPKNEVFSETSVPLDKEAKISVRTKKWKLISTLTNGNVELYDLNKDPHERNNVAGANPDVVNALLEKIKMHREKKKIVERKTLLYRAKMGLKEHSLEREL